MPHPHHTDANELGSVGLKGQDLPPKPGLENTVRLAIPKSNCDPGVYNKVSTMSEAGNGHFDRLTAGLSPEQRSEFFQALHEAGITPHDAELARLLRALQLYKAFYEEIPSRIHDALTEAHVLADDIKTLLDSFLKRLDTAVTQVGQTTQLASDTLNQLQALDRMLAAAIEESTTEITKSLDSALRKALSTALLAPFEDSVRDIHESCTATADQARQMTTELKLARRIHIGGYALATALCGLTLTVLSWVCISRYYAQREIELMRTLDQNRQILSELAHRGNDFELYRDPADGHKLYLVVNRAKAWTKEKRAVIELTD
jgi:hypothetical protein